jgi:hypothetical protein
LASAAASDFCSLSPAAAAFARVRLGFLAVAPSPRDALARDLAFRGGGFRSGGASALDAALAPDVVSAAVAAGTGSALSPEACCAASAAGA